MHARPPLPMLSSGSRRRRMKERECVRSRFARKQLWHREIASVWPSWRHSCVNL
jgi:hypothetical protein